ncbi:MAG: ABC transporter ATP-binding protein [Pirellulales bacterium]
MSANCCSENHLKLTDGIAECDHKLPPFPYGGRSHLGPQQTGPALEFNGVAISYPTTKRLVIGDVNLSVSRGQRVALVGHNGAGKSTLLKAAAGLIKPESGSIRVYGNAVGSCHHRTAYLPQRSDVDWHFPISVFDLVMTGRYVHLGWLRRPKVADNKLVLAALNRLAIADLTDRQIAELSGGQQQRALIARALVQQASLFLLDEPLNAVDEATRDIVDKVLGDHVKVGGSILVATHDLGRLSESFDVAVYLKEGRVYQIEQLPGVRSVTSVVTSDGVPAVTRGPR